MNTKKLIAKYHVKQIFDDLTENIRSQFVGIVSTAIVTATLFSLAGVGRNIEYVLTLGSKVKAVEVSIEELDRKIDKVENTVTRTEGKVDNLLINLASK